MESDRAEEIQGRQKYDAVFLIEKVQPNPLAFCQTQLISSGISDTIWTQSVADGLNDRECQQQQPNPP
jgi:hypothetical protein